MIEYYDQCPANELMDWKSLFAENRKAIEYELKSTNKNKE